MRAMLARMATTTTTPDRPASPLLAIRRRRNLNQERVAALSGLSRGWVGYLERNPEAMTATAAAKLAGVLGCEAKELLP